MTDPTTTDDRWHLVRTRTDRGFAYLPHIPSEYGGDIAVSESSAASGPHVWVRATAPVNLNDPAGPTHEVPIHLTADNALRLAEQLQLTAHEHYQGGPMDGEYAGDAPTLSRMLFEARELVEMHADIIERQSGQPLDQARRVVREIDAYRAGRGWSPGGFGGER